MISVDEFIRAELERSGRTSYSLEEIERLVREYREHTAAAEPCDCYACTANWRVPLGGWGE